MSDFIPNTFQTPNAVIDRLMELLTDSEFRVLMYTTRHVLGWQKKIKSKKAAISISNYVNGFSYTDAKGEKQSYSGCGLKDAAVRSALQSLEKYRVLKSEGVSEHGRTWELAFMTSDDVDFKGLEERLEEKQGKNKAKISQARGMNPLLASPVQQNPSCSTGVPPSCATEPLPSCSTGDNETHIETNIETHIADYAALPIPAGKVLKEKKPKERDRLFDGVALVCFNIKADDPAQKAVLTKNAGRIGKLVSFLNEVEATPEKLWGFKTWYCGKYPNTSIPNDVAKFSKHWNDYTQSVAITKPSTPQAPSANDTTILSLLESI